VNRTDSVDATLYSPKKPVYMFAISLG